MKNVFFSLAVLLLFFVCDGQGQHPSNPFDVSFNLNDNNNIPSGKGATEGYDIFVWEGSDTTGVDSSDMVQIWSGIHNDLLLLFPSGTVDLVNVYPSELNGEYIIAGSRTYNYGVDEDMQIITQYSNFLYSKAFEKAISQYPPINQTLPIMINY